jgi:hypothetical protein
MRRDLIHEKPYLKVISETIEEFYGSLLEFKEKLFKQWKFQILENNYGFDTWSQRKIDNDLLNEFCEILVKNLKHNLFESGGMERYLLENAKSLEVEYGHATSSQFRSEAYEVITLLKRGFMDWLTKKTSTFQFIESSPNSFYLNKFNAELNLFIREIEEINDMYYNAYMEAELLY